MENPGLQYPNGKRNCGMGGSPMLLLILLLLSTPALSQTPHGKIICVGDSITFGEGVPRSENFPSLIAKKSDAITTVNQGRSGWATSDYVKHLADVTSAIPADASIILIQLGANDLRIEGYTDQMVQNCATRMDQITDSFHKKAPHAQIILLSPINMFPADLSDRLKKAGFNEQAPEYLKKITDAYRALAKKKHYRFIDLYDTVTKGNTIDGVHPNIAGHRQMADAIWKTLQKEPEFPPADAKEVRPRAGLPNFLSKAAKGGQLRVAYFGGSITAQPGYRVQTLEWMNKTWPQTHFTEINAAIGGTGSDLGVFRFRRDVLSQKPDLVFVEFAVNDGGASPQAIIRCMEGIVRQAWHEDPSIDICFVYTFVDGWAKQLAAGQFPRAASVMEAVADHYAIPSIHMGLEAARMGESGQLIWRAKEKEQDGKPVFSADGVHPYPETGHKLYTAAVIRGFDAMKSLTQPAPHTLPAPLDPNNYENAKLIPIATFKSGFQPLDPTTGLAKSFHTYMPALMLAKPGQSITLHFTGTTLGFMDLLTPDSGLLQTTVDDQKPHETPRFDAYCTYPRIGSFFPARDLPMGDHTVTVTVTDHPLDKPAILAKNGNKIDNPQRYAGTNWYISWLMLVGDPK